VLGRGLINAEPRKLGWSVRQASRFSVTLGQLSYLDLIRGFVAVGRRMSVTLAAEDLHLTQSAVSRQVRTLEEMLGVKLLVRGHRSISLTVEGERLFRCGDEAIKQLQDVIGTIQVDLAARPVTAKKVAMAPNQSALSGGSEIVKRQFEFQRDDFQTEQLNPGAGIRDIVNRARVYAGAFAEKQQRALVDPGPSDRSSITYFSHGRTR
jgi:DNA-binding MarR family transcriptional regulator